MNSDRPMSPLRRRVVAVALPLSAALVGVPASAATVAATDGARARFMARAFEMRRLAVERGDQPYGAVVVRDGEIVGEGVSAVLTTPDPTAHGEIQAIRDASRRLRSTSLAGCELYTTFRPCPMCEAAAYWAGIARIFHGDAVSDAGAPRLSRC